MTLASRDRSWDGWRSALQSICRGGGGDGRRAPCQAGLAACAAEGTAAGAELGRAVRHGGPALEGVGTRHSRRGEHAGGAPECGGEAQVV